MEQYSYVYKIRNKTTGLYSLGGREPSWSKSGTGWPTLQCLTTYLSLFKTCTYNKLGFVYKWALPASYDNAEIIKLTYVLKLDSQDTEQSVGDFMKEHLDG